MDPVVRASLRARRLERAINLAGGDNPFQRGYFALRPETRTTATHGLRQAISGRVQAFVLPEPPLAVPEVACTKGLAELVSDGRWTINARVVARVETPTVFVFGFSVNNHGRYGFLLGGLYLPRGAPQFSSPTHTAVVTISGYSKWLSSNFDTACRAGVSFRIAGTTQLEDVSPRTLFRSWMSRFPEPLYRPLVLLDQARDIDIEGVPLGVGQPVDEDAPSEEDNPALSFDVALRFE